MLQFKEFLKEYLTDEQRKKYVDVKMTDKARKDTDHFFGKDNEFKTGRNLKVLMETNRRSIRS